MDRHPPLVCEENQVDSETDNIDDYYELSKLNNSFEDLEEELAKKGLLSHVAESTDRPLEVMGIENTWTEENAFVTPPSGDFPIPLPPPGGFDDIACLDTDTPAPEQGPFPDPDLGTLFSSESDAQEDVRDSAACPGVCGLRNLGNTCFMASGLQCLAATPSLMQYFLTRPSTEKDNTHSLTDQFASLLQKMWSGNYCVLRPVEFKQALGINYPQFKDFRQHDCQEFLALLLDNLHEQLNTASCKSILSDVSTAPPTPHSQCEMLDEREPPTRKLTVDGMDQESSTQTGISIEGLRCGHSSSSHSSESSGESRNLFRLRPIPEDIVSFKDVNVTDHKQEVSAKQEVNSIQTANQTELDKEEVRFICNQTSNSEINSNKFIAQKFIRKESDLNVEPVLEKNEVAHQLNNVSPCLRGFEDILKDAKTSNVNVLVTEQEANNEIRFDSEKFPKYENARRRDPLEMPNLTEFHNFDGKTVSVKRIKETNLLHETLDSPPECSEELDLESSKCFNNIKRMKLEEREKNFRMECERKLRGLDPTVVGESSSTDELLGAGASSCHSHLPINFNEEIEADKHWEKHLSANQSIIVDTFQGQFKSTVVCSTCKHVSVTYEPFMYLSVPLPHAMERQICVTFVPASSKEPIRYLVTLNKQDKVIKLKEQLIKCIGQDAPKNIALAEVLDSHIARILDENSLLRYVNDTNRSIYAFELLPPPVVLDIKNKNPDENSLPQCAGHGDSPDSGKKCGEPLDLAPGDLMDIPSNDGSGDPTSRTLEPVIGPLTESEYERLTGNSAKGDGWRSCAICLEEMDTDLRRHASCSCVLCESCIDTSCRHYGEDKLACPVCGIIVKPETEFIPLDKLGDYKPTIRLLNVPIVFRLDSEGDGNNNKKVMKLFGHPNLVRLPNRIQGQDLYTAVDRLVPYSVPYSILLVDGQGYHCSRCMYTVHCRGCHVAPEGELLLQTGDTLAVRFTEPIDHMDLAIEHPSMKLMRRQDPLSLYDCLQAFSESEQLDEHNPWYCPMCQKNQCATKTLSVWRYPDFLIVYLKSSCGRSESLVYVT
ncbi:uncharacterized protein [Periplaneta americana]|uniref:uncharacterized protein isoform X2 n=1 Tax=Periplaneta americana TaxID=6978 RepID=UPI0037E724C7